MNKAWYRIIGSLLLSLGLLLAFATAFFGISSLHSSTNVVLRCESLAKRMSYDLEKTSREVDNQVVVIKQASLAVDAFHATVKDMQDANSRITKQNQLAIQTAVETAHNYREGIVKAKSFAQTTVEVIHSQAVEMKQLCGAFEESASKLHDVTEKALPSTSKALEQAGKSFIQFESLASLVRDNSQVLLSEGSKTLGEADKAIGLYIESAELTKKSIDEMSQVTPAVVNAVADAGPIISKIGNTLNTTGTILNKIKVPTGVHWNKWTPGFDYSLPFEEEGLELVTAGRSLSKCGQTLPNLRKMPVDQLFKLVSSSAEQTVTSLKYARSAVMQINDSQTKTATGITKSAEEARLLLSAARSVVDLTKVSHKEMTESTMSLCKSVSVNAKDMATGINKFDDQLQQMLKAFSEMCDASANTLDNSQNALETISVEHAKISQSISKSLDHSAVALFSAQKALDTLASEKSPILQRNLQETASVINNFGTMMSSLIVYIYFAIALGSGMSLILLVSSYGMFVAAHKI